MLVTVAAITGSNYISYALMLVGGAACIWIPLSFFPRLRGRKVFAEICFVVGVAAAIAKVTTGFGPNSMDACASRTGAPDAVSVVITPIRTPPPRPRAGGGRCERGTPDRQALGGAGQACRHQADRGKARAVEHSRRQALRRIAIWVTFTRIMRTATRSASPPHGPARSSPAATPGLSRRATERRAWSAWDSRRFPRRPGSSKPKPRATTGRSSSGPCGTTVECKVTARSVGKSVSGSNTPAE